MGHLLCVLQCKTTYKSITPKHPKGLRVFRVYALVHRVFRVYALVLRVFRVYALGLRVCRVYALGLRV